MTDSNPATSETDLPRTPFWLWPIVLLALAALAALSPALQLSAMMHWAAVAVASLCVLVVTLALGGQVRKARRLIAEQRLTASMLTAPPPRSFAPPPAKPASAPNLPELHSELERLRNAERELIAAKHAAEAAMMAKGEFLATMSHEIRTPLNGIIPLLDLVMSTNLAPDQREYISTAFGSAKQLLSIVDDILDFSKLDANKLELENVGLNLKDIVDSVTRLMTKNAESKGIKFSAVIDPNVRIVGRGDPTRLRQVLTNLVSNSIKFTERGSVTVQVSKRHETRTHAELLFAVKDTGIGISPESQSKLFKEFSQADTSTTRTFGGTGLGLSICKRIVELMGGQIGVKSELGKGSIFWFTVPLGKALGDVAPGRSEIEGARALIVSGDQAMQRRLGGLLNGWSVQSVQNNVAADVVNKLKTSSGGSFAIDFLLLDFGSMRATALAILRGVLRESSLEAIRIVCISGDDQLPEEVRLAAQSSIISRNFADMELRSTMQGLLAAPRIPEPAPLLNSGDSNTLPQHSSTSPLVSAERANTGVGGHVLLVEDNPVNRQVAQRLLTLIGVSFETAENGKEGVDKAATGAFDAVLMDCQMPIMDGYTATRAMRKLQADGLLGKLPIIAMTANAMVGDREKCLSCGMDDYMSKPLNRTMIEQMLRKWLPPGATSKASATPAPATATAPRPLPTIAPSTRSEGAAIDMNVVRDLMDLMGSDFHDLIRVYLEDTPKNLSALERGAKSNDIDALVAPAHSLKSTSANLGALLLADMAKRIEQGARTGDIGEPVLMVAQLQNEYQRASAQLRQMLTG
jgi:signal transduction histidine kinase/CheY-like chemotaxis protein/HPt (histidine-containing phosphotransfer) domain-containing protein